MSLSKKKFFALILLTLSLSALSANEQAIKGSIQASGKKFKPNSSQATITLDEASKKALAKVNGKLVSAILEVEDGYLVYSVNIATKGKIQELLVDAGNGEILGMNQEDGKPKDKGDGDGEENDD